MRRMICVGAVSILAGCASQGDLDGQTRIFGYPAVQPVSAEIRQLPAPTPPPAAPEAIRRTDPPAPAPTPALAETPYEMERDPYVTAVLLPPVQTDRSLDFVERKDGRVAWPSNAAPPIIDLSDTHAAYADAE